MLKTYRVATILLMTSSIFAVEIPRKVPTAADSCQSATLTNPLFLKLEGINGDSTDTCHKNQIELMSFQNSGTSITVVKKIDLASPHLFVAAAAGTHIPQAELTVFQAGALPKVVIYKMKNVMVGAFDQTAGSTNRETVTLKFGTLETEVKSTATTGARATTPPAATDVTFLATGAQSIATMVNSGISNGQLREVVVNKPLDASSPKLMQSSQSGQHLTEVVITLRPRGGGAALVYKLTDVAVVGDIQQGSGSSATEQVRLKPAKFMLEYSSPSHPSQKTGWDVKAAKKV